MENIFGSKSGLSESELKDLILNNSYEMKSKGDLEVLSEKIGDASLVLLGEASHGTHEYYDVRSRISQHLIRDKGFSFIAVEGDWPDCYSVNRYVKNYEDSGYNAFEVLHRFNRWPTWMWANQEVVALAEWLKKHNDQFDRGHKAGFYGLDVYSLWESLDAIIRYLEKVDHDALEKAIRAFRCFEPYGDDEGQSYAYATQLVPMSCEREVISLLSEIRHKLSQYNTDPEMVFNAEQNALIAVNAESYYRAMIKGGPASWNIRDHHMMDTLNRLMQLHGNNAKAVVWEHNTHIGDARATNMASQGMKNVGQLARQQYGDDKVFAVGFGSYKGTVIAGRKWNDVMRVMHIPEAIPGSWEYILHQMDAKDRIVFMTDEMKKHLGKQKIGHRAIGVVYQPQYEQAGNYVPSIMPFRYDAFIYLDHTTALNPLHIEPDEHQTPETYPFNM